MKSSDSRTPWRDRLSRLLLAGYFVGMPLAVINPVLFDAAGPAGLATATDDALFTTPDHLVATCPEHGPRVPTGDCPAGAPMLDAPLWLYGTLDEAIG